MRSNKSVMLALLGIALVAASCASTGKAIIDQYKNVTPNRFEGAVAVVLEKRRHTRVNGKQAVLEGFSRTKLLDRKAMDCSNPDNTTCRLVDVVCYKEGIDEVELLEVRTITPDGTIIELDDDDMKDVMTSTWAEPETSLRCLQFQVKGATPGAIVETR